MAKRCVLGLVFLACIAAAIAQTDQAKKDAQNDVKVGKEYVAELEKGLKLSKDQAAIDRINRIGQSLAAIANATAIKATYGDSRQFHFDYVFKLVEDKDVNAFSVPGGFIYVNTGLLSFAETDDELAAVLAHEIGHAAHRHIATLTKERSKVDLATLPIVLAALLGNSKDAGALLVTQQLLQTALTNSWSQDAEKDADQTGFHILLKSEYAPAAMLTFLERLAFRESNSPNYNWGIERTHPPSIARVRALQALIAQYKVPLERSKITTSFRTVAKQNGAMSDIFFGTRLLFSLHDSTSSPRVVETVENLNWFFDQRPQIFELRADGSTLVGRGKPLVAFRSDDGSQSAIQNMRNALFSLSLRTANN